ncbi:MAG TPA: hypothetical protein VGW34_09950 [Allosphingosinicella sp.]|nr:hypothetical protein [Allosphingosinicella sp.]
MQWLLALIGTLAGGAVTAFLAWLAWPKTQAEARLIEEQAEGAVWQRWQNEIARLEAIITRQSGKIDRQGERIAGLEERVRGFVDREAVLLADNRRMAARIAELEAMRMPAELADRHPTIVGVSGALRSAIPPPADLEGARMEKMIGRARRAGDGSAGGRAGGEGEEGDGSREAG